MAEQIFKSPGFYEREIDLTAEVQGPTGIPGGVIGVSQKGPAFVPVTVGSFNDYVTKFGTLDPNMPAPYASNVFLKNKFALTFVRTLGAGANATIADIDATRTQGIVVNAGFKLSGSVVNSGVDNRHNHTVQFLTARHVVSNNEAFGMPMFSNNSSYFTTTPGEANLVRGVLFTTSDSRIMVLGASDSFSNTADDLATPDTSGKFKIVISSSAGATFGNSDGINGIKIVTASLNPTNDDYVGKILNTDPTKFAEEKHLLYLNFAVDDEIATVYTGSNSICIASGSANTSTNSGNTTLPFRNAFGRYDTRYTSAKTPSIISQPYGLTEYDLFHFEPLTDGAQPNNDIKVSIANIQASTDPKNLYGTFTVLVRSFADDDLNPQIIEQFNDCNLNPDSDKYIGKIIGDKKVFFNFDVENADDRRLIRSGNYANRSKYVRVVVNQSVEDKAIPATCLPFGFRGIEVLKTNPVLTDITGSAALIRLGATGSANNLLGSIVPPLPFRFKVTRGEVTTSVGPIGNPGATEVADTRYYWGVKFSRNNSDVLNTNVNSELNPIIEAYTKFAGLNKLDVLVTGSSADVFNNNKFSLARVAFGNGALTDLTASVPQHMKATAYVRDGVPNPSDYTLNDGVMDRITFATLLQKDTATNFNRFANFAKFTTVFYGGFDGLNILDKEAVYMTDKASSNELNGGANVAYTSPGFATNQNGTGKSNNIIASYQQAIDLITDPFASNVNVFAVPGQREPLVTDYALEQAADYALAEYIMDIPYYDSDQVRIFDGEKGRYISVSKTADAFETRTVDNVFGAAYFPNIIVDDTVNNRRVTLPASVAALAAISYNDKVAYPWFAPAGFNRASLDFVKMTQVKVKQPERDRLYTVRINPVIKLPGESYVIFSQQTLEQAGTALQSLNVQRMVLTIKQQISQAGNGIIWEQLTPSLRERWVNIVKTIMSTVQVKDGIERFDIVCDERNNTELDVLNNKMNCKIKFIPVRVAEFISIDFIITNSGVQFI
jgi:hypothetical protein